jgi:dipeptide/tripeptide permease
MLKLLRKFPPTFHVANFMEIFERMAWYGFYSVSGLYITGSVASGGLGLSDVQRGVIVGIIPFLLYLFPVVTGAFADKFGYKRTFFLAYLVMTPCYFLLGQARSFWSFFFFFFLVAIGAALFKPVVTGTIARTTTLETKAIGFGVFYMVVNIGGFLGPMVATVVRGWGWNWVFVMSAIWIGFNFVPLMLFYKEPSHGKVDEVMSTRERIRRWMTDMMNVLGNLRLFTFTAGLLLLLMLAGGDWITWTVFFWGSGIWTVVNFGVDAATRPAARRAEGTGVKSVFWWGPMRIGDWRFALYLLILSGFWTVFNQIFLTMPLYIRDYTDTTVIQNGLRTLFEAIPLVGQSLAEAWNWVLRYITEDGQIKPENLINLDALAIVFGQVAVSAIFAKWKPFTTMIVGTIVTAGSMLLGIGSSMGWICVTAIVVFAVGEMMASPKSQEYVARIAPPEKAAGYMGYYFVTIALGNLFGGLLSGQAYQYFANPQTGIGRPDIMWMIFAIISVVTAIALALFNRYCSRPESDENNQATA